MGELIPFPEQETTKEKLADELSWKALWKVAAQYGSGYWEDESMPDIAELSYHNLTHSKRVCDTAQ